MILGTGLGDQEIHLGSQVVVINMYKITLYSVKEYERGLKSVAF